jgi:Putative transposase, YhgA-like
MFGNHRVPARLSRNTQKRPLRNGSNPATRLNGGTCPPTADLRSFCRLLLRRRRMGHDQLFKSILKKCLRDFLELFFPEVAARLDFETMQPMGKEVFTGFPEGNRREVDFLARVNTHQGDPEFILVHVEVQARPEKDFARRMFEYAAALWLAHKAPVFPVVLYLRGGEGLSEEEFDLTLFGREIFRFRYAALGLARLNAQEYLEASALGVALASLMRRDVADKVVLRAEMLRRVIESGVDEAILYLLVNVIETYFPLTGAELERFEQLVSRKEYRNVQEDELTWADRIHEKGREAGVIEGKRESLLKLLTAKFGSLPAETTSRVQNFVSGTDLDRYLEQAATSTSLEEVGL